MLWKARLGKGNENNFTNWLLIFYHRAHRELREHREERGEGFHNKRVLNEEITELTGWLAVGLDKTKL